MDLVSCIPLKLDSVAELQSCLQEEAKPKAPAPQTVIKASLLQKDEPKVRHIFPVTLLSCSIIMQWYLPMH